MPSALKPRVFYMGDWAFQVGPLFTESPFYHEAKDTDLHFYGQRLADALASKAELTCMPSWQLYRLPPGEFEKQMRKSAAVIISDVETQCFGLYPAFFDRAKRERRVVTFPDRLMNLKKWVRGGGGLMMVGGWLSFSGSHERAGWRRSALAEALPVQCLVGDDLVESSRGFTVEVMQPDHPIVRGLPWKSCPPIFGYNEVIPKEHADVIVRVKQTGHPLVVAGQYGKGRIAVYASDPAPHWGINFELWKGYDRFWQQMFRWVSGSAR